MMAHIGSSSTPDKIMKNSSVDRNVTSTHIAVYKARNLYSQISQESLRNHHPDEDFCFFNTDKASAQQHVNMYNPHAVPQHH